MFGLRVTRLLAFLAAPTDATTYSSFVSNALKSDVELNSRVGPQRFNEYFKQFNYIKIIHT